MSTSKAPTEIPTLSKPLPSSGVRTGNEPTGSAYDKELRESCLEPSFPTFDSHSPYSTKSEEIPVRHIQPPNPGWKFGDGVETTELGRKWMEGAKEGWERVDCGVGDFKKIYPLLLAGVQPRPIAFVSSISANGVENLAPYSFFQVVCPVPPLVMISALDLPRVKDTTANIAASETKQFTVNIISLPWIEQANICSIPSPENVSEWDLSGLTREPSTHIRPARVRESAFSMECEFYNDMELSTPGLPRTGTLTFGLIKCMHIRKDIINARGMPDAAKLMAVSRMGDISYGLTTEAFRLPRPNWEVDGDEIRRVLAEKKKAKEGEAAASL